MFKVTEDYEVCRTGKLNQFYTLYIHRQTIGDGFALYSRQFVQNLAHDEDVAWDKCKEMMDDKKSRLTRTGMDYFCCMDLLESPKTEYCDLQAFGYEWKKTNKGFTTIPDKPFWTIWRKHKSALKEAGFSVFKSDITLEFILFYRNTTEENMVSAFAMMEDKMENQVVTGKYMGEIKERLRDIPAYVESVRETEGYYGTSQVVTFTYGAFILHTFYSGATKIVEGSSVMLTGTVKKQEVYDGKKVTSLSRIIIDTISE